MTDRNFIEKDTLRTELADFSETEMVITADFASTEKAYSAERKIHSCKIVTRWFFIHELELDWIKHLFKIYVTWESIYTWDTSFENMKLDEAMFNHKLKNALIAMLETLVWILWVDPLSPLWIQLVYR